MPRKLFALKLIKGQRIDDAMRPVNQLPSSSELYARADWLQRQANAMRTLADFAFQQELETSVNMPRVKE